MYRWNNLKYLKKCQKSPISAHLCPFRKIPIFRKSKIEKSKHPRSLPPLLHPWWRLSICRFCWFWRQREKFYFFSWHSSYWEDNVDQKFIKISQAVYEEIKYASSFPSKHFLAQPRFIFSWERRDTKIISANTKEVRLMIFDRKEQIENFGEILISFNLGTPWNLIVWYFMGLFENCVVKFLESLWPLVEICFWVGQKI